MDPPYGAIFLLFIFFGLVGIVGIVKARRRGEKTYCLVSGVAFLVVLAVAVALLSQFLLSFAIIVVAGLLSIVLLPRVIVLYGQEIVEQKQETDVSAPLRLKDFLSWKAWLKIESIYGFRKMMIIYSLFNITLGGTVLITLVVLNIINPVIAISTAVATTIYSITIFYRQIWKAFKK